MVLLAKCCAEFRHVLDLEMTEENRDQVLGTGILIHYLCWCDTSFLDGQQRNLDGTYRQLDLSQDRLFLLSEGVRHVRFLSWQLSNPEGSIFWKLVIEKKCAVLREVFMQCGLDYARLRPRVIALYDDPRFIGNGRDDSSATPDDAAPGTANPAAPGSREKLPFWTVPCTHLFSDAHILSILALQVPPTDNDKNPVEQKLYDRLSFEIVADRISLIIHLTLLREAEKAEGSPKLLDLSNVRLRSEVERCFLSFPLIAYRPFHQLICAGDSRAFVILFFFYRAVRTISPDIPNAWWARERGILMEDLLRKELQNRGLWETLRELDFGPMD